jgi:hypothetical protein
VGFGFGFLRRDGLSGRGGFLRGVGFVGAGLGVGAGVRVGVGVGVGVVRGWHFVGICGLLVFCDDGEASGCVMRWTMEEGREMGEDEGEIYTIPISKLISDVCIRCMFAVRVHVC